jgi:hypothetical protein
MNTLRRSLIAAGLAASLGLAAIAQPQPQATAAPDVPQVEQRQDRMHKKVERKLGKLKEKLQISAAQEPAWTAWTGAIRPGPTMERPKRAEFAALHTPERIDRIRALRAQRNAEMDKRLDATKSFYAALTADQKKVFDAESLRFAKRHHGKRGASHRG